MAVPISPVRIQFLFKRGARLFHPFTKPMKPGLQNGYAITAFDDELELRTAVKHYKYSELIKQCVWKVGTAETTEIRLKKMFGIKRPLVTPQDIWDRFYIPLTDRLSKYQGDTKAGEPGQCEWMREVLLKKFDSNGKVAILMLPLILGFAGNDKAIENEMSEMLTNAGGEVHNDKRKQNAKDRAASTDAQIGLKDEDYGVDKLLKLTPTLKKIGFDVHPEYKGRK